MSLCFCFDFVCVCLFCLFFLALNKNLPWPFANQRHSSWSPEKTWRWWSASSAGLPVPNRVLSCFIHTNTSRIYNAQRNGLSFLFFSSFKIIRKKKKIIFQSKICCCLLAGAQRHRQLKSLNNQTKNWVMISSIFSSYFLKILCCCATINCLFSRRIIWA